MEMRSSQDEVRDQRLPDLLRQLSDQTATLVRQELELAKAEMAEKGKQVGLGAGMFGGAGLFGLLALGSLTACLIAALDSGMELWLAALLVAFVYAGIAGALALRGKQKTQEAMPPAPEEAIDSTKEDVQWAKTRAKSAKR